MEAVNSTIHLKKGRDKPLRNRHPWVFSGAIARVSGDPSAGDLVQILSSNGAFMGVGYFNANSQMRARVVSWVDGESLDEAFWSNLLAAAIQRRRLLNLEQVTNAIRLINAEADGIPGLVVDRYGDFLVMQCLTMGIDQRKEMLAKLLFDLIQPKGIVERSDAKVRRKEGLPLFKGVLLGESPPDEIVVTEHGLKFGVRLLGGHKTGMYLDQRDNRPKTTHPTIVEGKEVLNVFSYTGGFGIYAAHNGAAKVVNIDSSVPVLELAERNMHHNGIDPDQHEQIAGDAFQILRDFREEGRKFDLVVLDPPKFVHSQRDIQKATRGYKDLNLLACQLLRENGVLATFSCSGLVSADLYQKVVFGAVVDAKKNAQIMATLTQAADHPVSLTFPESAYLKGLLCRVW